MRITVAAPGEAEPDTATATIDPPRTPAVGDTVHLHHLHGRGAFAAPEHRSEPATVLRVCDPSRPDSPLDLETEWEAIHHDCEAIRPEVSTSPNMALEHWAPVDAIGGPITDTRPDRKPKVGQTVSIFTYMPEKVTADRNTRYAPIQWRIGRVVDARGDDELLDIAVAETERHVNIHAAGEEPADRTWSWSPAPDQPQTED